MSVTKPCSKCGHPRNYRRGGGGFGSGYSFTLLPCERCVKEKKKGKTDG